MNPLAFTSLLDLIPPSLRPYAKAVAPRAAAILVLFLDLVRNGGQIDRGALEIAVVAFIAASITFWVDNTPTGWRRYAKAIAPAVLTLIGVAVHAIVTGDFDETTARIAAAGLGSALLSLVIPNDTGALEPPPPLAASVEADGTALMPLLADEDATGLADGQNRAANAKPPLTPGTSS
jgi:hypothetical protein